MEGVAAGLGQSQGRGWPWRGSWTHRLAGGKAAPLVWAGCHPGACVAGREGSLALAVCEEQVPGVLVVCHPLELYHAITLAHDGDNVYLI